MEDNTKVCKHCGKGYVLPKGCTYGVTHNIFCYECLKEMMAKAKPYKPVVDKI